MGHNYLSSVPANVLIYSPEPTINTPVEVQNYPYGFTTKTKARYYVETRKGTGQRVVFQTLNPKTGQWNKPKAGIYNEIMVLYYNPVNGHVENTGLSFTYADAEDLAEFLKRFPENKLTAYQRQRIVLFRAILETRKHVHVTITSSGVYSMADLMKPEVQAKFKKEADERKAKDKEVGKTLHGLLGVYFNEATAKAEGRPVDPETADLLKKIREERKP